MHIYKDRHSIAMKPSKQSYPLDQPTTWKIQVPKCLAESKGEEAQDIPLITSEFAGGRGVGLRRRFETLTLKKDTG